jgi:hypothetical protein
MKYWKIVLCLTKPCSFLCYMEIYCIEVVLYKLFSFCMFSIEAPNCITVFLPYWILSRFSLSHIESNWYFQNEGVLPWRKVNGFAGGFLYHWAYDQSSSTCCLSVAWGMEFPNVWFKSVGNPSCGRYCLNYHDRVISTWDFPWEIKVNL